MNEIEQVGGFEIFREKQTELLLLDVKNQHGDFWKEEKKKEKEKLNQKKIFETQVKKLVLHCNSA